MTCICFYFSEIHCITKLYLFTRVFICIVYVCILVCVNSLVCATAWVEIAGNIQRSVISSYQVGPGD